MVSLSKRYESLCNPVWNIAIIKEYCECGTNKAADIRKAAIKEHNGTIPYLKDCVRADSVMLAIGTTREKELKIISQALQDIGRLTKGAM